MATASAVQVPNVASVQASVDNVQVTTVAGTVQRQVVAIADATTAGQYALVDSGGAVSVKPTTSSALTPTETNPSIAATAGGTTALASNASAKYRFIQNTTVTPAWLSIAGTPAVGTGMLIGPYGTYECSAAIGNLFTGTIKAISTSGSITFYCLEGA